MYKALLLCVLIGLAACVSVRDGKKEFMKFQKKYNKAYNPSEVSERFQIFQQNLARYEVLSKKNPLARFGVNKFSDLSPAEFSKYYLMPRVNFTRDYKAPPAKTVFETTNVAKPNPMNWDWFTQGVCTPIYNQGQCGSCWAFSATETIESYHAFKSGKQAVGLSMEQIVDCDTAGEDQGCEGGFPTGAYQYVESAGGIDSYSSYPYTAGEGQAGQCQFNQANVVTNVASYNTISGETGLYSQASTGGPVSVCVDASTWSGYTGGILTSCGNDVDHCVQLTGYANYGQSGDYWIVRNSWGTDWGNSGFIWIAIGQDLCSIGDYATIVSTTN